MFQPVASFTRKSSLKIHEVRVRLTISSNSSVRFNLV